MSGRTYTPRASNGDLLVGSRIRMTHWRHDLDAEVLANHNHMTWILLSNGCYDTIPTNSHFLDPSPGAPMNEIPEHLLRRAQAARDAATRDMIANTTNACGIDTAHGIHRWSTPAGFMRTCPGVRPGVRRGATETDATTTELTGRVVDGSTFTAGGPVANTDPAGVLHIPRSLLDATKNSGSIDDLVHLIETNATWDADGPVIPPRIVIDDDLDAALMAAAHEADERESEARYELSVARLDHWASTFRNCPDDHRFTDDELDQLSHLLTWAANQINHGNEATEARAAEAPTETGLEDIVDAVMDAIDATIAQARTILDRVAERLGDRP